MLRDQFRLKRELQRLRSAKLADKDNQAALESLREKLDRSIAKRRSREENLPETNIDSTLPIFERRDEIIETIQKNQVVIISGETGSGTETEAEEEGVVRVMMTPVRSSDASEET